MNFQEAAPGVFVVRYEEPGDLAPPKQERLVAAVREAAARGRSAIVFVLAKGILWVDISVPGYWLTVTSDATMRLAAIAVVSPSHAVGIATKAFGLRNRLMNVPVAVQHFQTEEEAKGWVRGVLEQAAA